MVRENARTVQDQLAFAKRYEEMTQQYELEKDTLDKAVKEKAYRQAKQLRCELILRL